MSGASTQAEIRPVRRSIAAQARFDFLERVAAGIWDEQHSPRFAVTWTTAVVYAETEDDCELHEAVTEAVAVTRRAARQAVGAMKLRYIYDASRLCEAGEAAAGIDRGQALAAFNAMIAEVLA